MPKRSSKPKGDANVIGFLVAQMATGSVQPDSGEECGEGDSDPSALGSPEVHGREREHQVEGGGEEAPDQGKNPAAVALGRLGGLKGGRARADALSPKKRSEIAKKAAQTRWKDRQR